MNLDKTITSLIIKASRGSGNNTVDLNQFATDLKYNKFHTTGLCKIITGKFKTDKRKIAKVRIIKEVSKDSQRKVPYILSDRQPPQ